MKGKDSEAQSVAVVDVSIFHWSGEHGVSGGLMPFKVICPHINKS